LIATIGKCRELKSLVLPVFYYSIPVLGGIAKMIQKMMYLQQLTFISMNDSTILSPQMYPPSIANIRSSYIEYLQNEKM